jgi:hypothetical protein
MKLFGFFYKENFKINIYVLKKNKFFYLTDQSNINEWFINEKSILEYCLNHFDKFEVI